MAQRFKLTPQFRVIIDFSVEDQDGVAIVTDHGLIAMFEIDDLEAHRAQRDVGGFPHVLPVRSPMD